MATFAAEDIERAVGEIPYLQGLECFGRGRVRRVEFDGADRIHGEVSGSQPEPYTVVARYKSARDGTLLPLEGHCSCPVGVKCKHMAALLLAARHVFAEAERRGSRKKDRSVPSTVWRWLNEGSKAIDAARAPAPSSSNPPMRGGSHLFYVVHRHSTDGMRIDPYRAYLKKDGTIGMSNRAYHDRTEPVSRRLMTARDAAILGTLDYYNTGRYPGAYHWPGGDALVELVRGIVETGRARALDIHGPTLFWAEPQQCELAWTVDEAGAQRIEARDGAGSPMVLLPFPIPFFVDLQTGQIGVAQTALPGGVASWLVGAPPVPHGAIERVTSRLAWVEGKMPVPRFRRVEERTDIGPQPLLSLYGVELQALYGGGPGDVTPSTWPHARLEITYAGAGEVVRPGEGGSLRLLGEDAVILRHQEREAAFAERFRRAADPYRCDEGTSRRFHASSPYESHDDDVVFPRVRKEDEDADAGGLGFAIHVVPGLRAASWRIEIDPSWPFPLHERQVAFSASLEETETDWFSLRLSLATEGGTFDVAPIVLQLVADLPVDRQGRLEEGFEVERHLAGKTFRVRLDDGSRVGLEASLFARFAEAFLEAQGVLEFHRSDAGRLLALAEALDGCGAPWSGRRELLDLGARLRALAATP